MPVAIQLRDGLKTDITVRDHKWHADEPVAEGGTDTAPTPGEMMLGALGSCIAITCQMYANHKGWDLQGVDVQVDYERFKGSEYEAHEGSDLYVHEVRKFVKFYGDLDEKQLKRLYDVATKCPVHRLISTPTYFAELAIDEDEANPES
jgi:putative redox protein